jgi:hypothetical protein
MWVYQAILFLSEGEDMDSSTIGAMMAGMGAIGDMAAEQSTIRAVATAKQSVFGPMRRELYMLGIILPRRICNEANGKVWLGRSCRGWTSRVSSVN